MRRTHHLVILLLLSAVLGVATAWATQYLFVQQTSEVTEVSLCTGPTVVGFQCPKPTIPVEKRGYPFAFISQAKPSPPTETGYMLSEGQLTRHFNTRNYVTSAMFWSVVFFLFGLLAKSVHSRYFLKH